MNNQIRRDLRRGTIAAVSELAKGEVDMVVPAVGEMMEIACVLRRVRFSGHSLHLLECVFLLRAFAFEPANVDLQIRCSTEDWENWELCRGRPASSMNAKTASPLRTRR